MFAGYIVLSSCVPLLYVVFSVLYVQDIIKAFEFEFEFEYDMDQAMLQHRSW